MVYVYACICRIRILQYYNRPICCCYTMIFMGAVGWVWDRGV